MEIGKEGFGSTALGRTGAGPAATGERSANQNLVPSGASVGCGRSSLTWSCGGSPVGWRSCCGLTGGCLGWRMTDQANPRRVAPGTAKGNLIALNVFYRWVGERHGVVNPVVRRAARGLSR